METTTNPVAAVEGLSPEVVEECKRLIAGVDLRGIHLVNVSAAIEQSAFALGDGEAQADVSVRLVSDPPQHRANFDEAAGLLYCGVKFKVALVLEEKGETLLDVRAEYALIYGVPDGVSCSSEAASLFARKNGVFNSWPFFRELAQSLSCRMGFPAVVLPLLRLSEIPSK